MPPGDEIRTLSVDRRSIRTGDATAAATTTEEEKMEEDEEEQEKEEEVEEKRKGNGKGEFATSDVKHVLQETVSIRFSRPTVRMRDEN